MALVRWLEESPIRPEEAGAVRCTRCGTQLDFTNVRICCVCAELYCYMHCVSGLCDRCYSLPDSEAEVADAQTRMVPATHEAAVAVATRPQSRSDQVNVVDSSPVRPARRRILDDLVVRRLWWLSPLRPDEDESDYESTSSSSSRSVWDGTNSSVAESTVASIGSIMTSAWLLRAVGLPDLDPRPARRSDLYRWTSRRLEMFHFQVSDDDIDYVQFTSASETSSSTSAATMRTSTAEPSLEAAFQGSERAPLTSLGRSEL